MEKTSDDCRSIESRPRYANPTDCSPTSAGNSLPRAARAMPRTSKMSAKSAPNSIVTKALT
jgi:hypothetical protein